MRTAQSVGLLLMTLLAGLGLAQQPPPIFTTRADLVVVHATVVDRRGGFITDLPQAAFSIFEDGVSQQITLFSHEDSPAVVGIVIDNSGSMQPNRDAVIAAGLAFARASHPQDELFTVNFNENIWPGLPDGLAFTTDHAVLQQALLSTRVRGRTALYDAIASAVKHVSAREAQKKVLLVISDGGDNASTTSLQDVLTLARQSDAVIYTFGLFDPLERNNGKSVLKQIAQDTGGQAQFPDEPDDIIPMLERIALEIRSGYTIGYQPTNTALDGTYRRLRVVVTPRGRDRVRVRARDGYLAEQSREVSP